MGKGVGPHAVATKELIHRVPGGVPVPTTARGGGWLLQAWREQKVFIDGGTDVHGSDLLGASLDILWLRPGRREFLDSWGIRHVLLNVDSHLANELAREEEWGLHRGDATGVLPNRGSPRNGQEGSRLAACLEAKEDRDTVL